jgi:glycosyl transferase family 87
MWAAARRGRWTSAALVLGMTMSVKPFLVLLLLPFAFRRKWLALIVAAGVAAVSFSMGAAVLGLRPFISWIAAIRSVTWAGHVFNGSLFGISSRLLANRPLPIWQLEPMVRAPEWIQPIWIVAAGVLLALTIWRLYAPRARNSQADQQPSAVDREFATMLSSALLITPLGWIYYHFFLAGPCIALLAHEEWRKALQWRWLVLAGATICFMLSPGNLTSGQPNAWASLTVGSAYFWGLLGVWTCAAVAT